jgi:hypothetical protein
LAKGYARLFLELSYLQPSIRLTTYSHVHQSPRSKCDRGPFRYICIRAWGHYLGDVVEPGSVKLLRRSGLHPGCQGRFWILMEAMCETGHRRMQWTELPSSSFAPAVRPKMPQLDSRVANMTSVANYVANRYSNAESPMGSTQGRLTT